MLSLVGKSLLVTGAGGGIGRSIALAGAKQGANVVVADLNRDGANETVEMIQKQSPLRDRVFSAISVETNIADEDSVYNTYEEMKKAFGSVDLVVNNAGIQHIDEIANLSFQNWRKVVGINLDGSFLVGRGAMQHMIKQGTGGRIVFIGSVHSKQASKAKAPYIAAKHGVLGLARAAALEGAPHQIATNVICPGFVDTPLVRKQIPEQAETLGITEEEVVKNVMLRNQITGEFVDVEEVSDAVVFCLAQKKLALTGQSILVSGGWHME